jgi:hypothetical protein
VWKRYWPAVCLWLVLLRGTTKVGTLGSEGGAPGSGKAATSSRLWVLVGRTQPCRQRDGLRGKAIRDGAVFRAPSRN